MANQTPALERLCREHLGGPKRRIRTIPREELAQVLIDAAVTPEGIEDAREGIRELGLAPANFTSKF